MRKGRAGLVALLVACLAVGVGLRLESVRHKETPSHDESISFIAATCHQDAYEREAPVGRDVPAAEWQRFWNTGDGTFCFAAIGRGLANTDLHPPLYFWLLHLWSLIFGVGLTQGVWLNLLIVALTAAALFGLGRTVFRNDWQAGLLAGLWVLSPATIAISTEARQYDLFALVTVLFLWQLLRMTGQKRDLVLLALATTAGMLTHYLFALVIAGAAVIVLVRRARILATGGAILAGLVLAALLHPGFTQSLETASNRGRGSDSTGDRLDHVLNTIGDYVTGHAVRHGKVVAIVMLLALAALVIVRRRHREGWELPFMAVWLGGGIALLYVAGLSPGHAMGVSYLAPAWPFVGAVVILLVRDRRIQALAVAVMLVAGVVSAVRVDNANARLTAPQKVLRGSDPILLGNTKRGFVPPALWHVRADRPVLADRIPPLLYITTRKVSGGKLRGKIVLWDPENLVGGTAERVYRVAR